MSTYNFNYKKMYLNVKMKYSTIKEREVSEAKAYGIEEMEEMEEMEESIDNSHKLNVNSKPYSMSIYPATKNYFSSDHLPITQKFIISGKQYTGMSWNVMNIAKKIYTRNGTSFYTGPYNMEETTEQFEVRRKSQRDYIKRMTAKYDLDFVLLQECTLFHDITGRKTSEFDGYHILSVESFNIEMQKHIGYPYSNYKKCVILLKEKYDYEYMYDSDHEKMLKSNNEQIRHFSVTWLIGEIEIQLTSMHLQYTNLKIDYEFNILQLRSNRCNQPSYYILGGDTNFNSFLDNATSFHHGSLNSIDRFVTNITKEYDTHTNLGVFTPDEDGFIVYKP